MVTQGTSIACGSIPPAWLCDGVYRSIGPATLKRVVPAHRINCRAAQRRKWRIDPVDRAIRGREGGETVFQIELNCHR